MKQDPKLVAAEEIYFISTHYKIPAKEVRTAIQSLKKDGKGFRSRASIYARLRLMGWTVKTRRFPDERKKTSKDFKKFIDNKKKKGPSDKKILMDGGTSKAL